MKNMQAKLFIILLFLIKILFAKDTIYYDNNWKKTTKNNSSYFRPLPFQKNGNVYLVRDYYKNGNLQMQAYVLDKDDDSSFVGDVFYYNIDGVDKRVESFINNSKTKELIYYNHKGKLWQKNLYNDEGEISKIEVFKDAKIIASGIIKEKKLEGSFIRIPSDFYLTPEMLKEGSIMIGGSGNPEFRTFLNFSEIIFWENGNKAKEVKYSRKSDNSFDISTTYWNENGVLVPEETIDQKGYTTNVYFTYHLKNGFAKSYKLKRKSYANTFLTVENYDVDGNLDQKLIYKNYKPYDGFFVDYEDGRFLKTATLKEGIYIDEFIVKNRDNIEISRGIYKDSKPFSGTFITDVYGEKGFAYYLINNYVDGVISGKQQEFDSHFKLLKEYEINN